MNLYQACDLHSTISDIYRRESRRVLATLIRLLKDFDLAEEALQEAFSAALTQWPNEGIPKNPRAWLVSTGRFKAIDHLRRRARFHASLDLIAAELEEATSDSTTWADEQIEDDQLRLIFTCCHPSLSPEAQIALTLREVCGLTTEEIARAFLVTPTTIAQRIVRAKAKIRDANIPYEIPAPHEFPARMDAVLRVIYLVYNEGYSSSSGETLTRHDLVQEAIRLARLMEELQPTHEVYGLLALMLIQDARRATRVDIHGDVILLEHQDRSQWNHLQIAEGSALIQRALANGNIGSYTLQAAITAVHAEAKTFAETNWPEIIGLYDVLLQVTPSPIIELNRAVAVAMRDGAEAGLSIIENLIAREQLKDYHLLHAAHADLLTKLDQREAAEAAYKMALRLTSQAPEQRYLQKKLMELANRSANL